MKNFYRLIQGDCLKVLPTLEDESIDLAITDPPYNISKLNADITRDHFNNPNLKRKRTIHYNFGDWDRLKVDDYFSFMQEWIELLIPKLSDNCNFVSFIAKENISLLHYFLQEKGFKFRNIMAWVKTNPVPHLRKVNFASGMEFIYWASKGKNVFNYKLGHSTNYFIHPLCMGAERTRHPTQKPESLINWIVQYLSNKDQTVLDPFLGSGTIMKVCQDLGRSCIGIEINSEYCGIIKKRCFGRTFLDHEVEYKFEVFK